MFFITLLCFTSLSLAEEPKEKGEEEAEIGGEVAVAREGREDTLRIEIENGIELSSAFSLEISGAEELPIAGKEEPFVYAVLGPAWRVGDHFKARIGVGSESSTLPLHASFAVRYKSDKFNACGTLEYSGHNGVWYRGIATVRFGRIKIGAHTQTHHGVGPTLITDIGTVHPWITPMVGFEEGTFMERMSLLAGVAWNPKLH